MQIGPQNDSPSTALSRNQMSSLDLRENQSAPEASQSDDIINGKRKLLRKPAISVLLSFNGGGSHDSHRKNLDG
jgi:hypothetical protein